MQVLDLRVRTQRSWEAWMRAPELARIPRALHRCWRRARGLGVRAEGPPLEAILPAAALRERRDASGALLRVLPEVLSPVISALSAQDFRLLVADADGAVLRAEGGGGFAHHADTVRLIEGSVWSEATRGTNAIGTAIEEARPVAVLGAAHFVQANHGLACYAAPVLDPYGQVRAVLDATSFAHAQAPMAALAVVAAAGSLEARLRAEAWAQLPASTALLQRLMARFPGPALLVQRPGQISHANAAAAARLGLQTIPAGDVDGLDAVCQATAGLDWGVLEQAARTGRRAHIGDQLADVEPLLAADGRVLAVAAFLRAPRRARATAAAVDPFRSLVGRDPALVSAVARARRLATTRLPLLLLAETGTGKGLLAQAIHDASPRSRGPFVALNCGALSEDLLMAELFGHAPGAFTGASRTGRAGRLAEADGGTLFLDEVAEMSGRMQAALLRFLEDGVYRPVGGGQLQRTDVRLISATCRDLPEAIATGRFRQDLYYRLCGAPLSLPTLRQRSDLHELAAALLRQRRADDGEPFSATLSPEARDWIAAQSWPGNVRQLKSALHVASVLADGAPIRPEHFPPDITRPLSAPAEVAESAEASSLAEVEQLALTQALSEANGNISAAARILGVARSTVYRLMARHGLR